MRKIKKIIKPMRNIFKDILNLKPTTDELEASEKISRGLAEKNILIRSELIRFGIFPFIIFLILLMVWLIIIAFKLL